MKTCNQCNNDYDLCEFYKNKKMLDGHFHQCKSCVKSRVARHRRNNAERINAYDRGRSHAPKRIKARKDYAERMKNNPEAKAKSIISKKEWQSKNMVKRAAHVLLGNAIKNRKITKGTTCENCGCNNKTLEGHHEDYFCPLDVVWLCSDCHGLRHREINEMIRGGIDLSDKGF